MAFRRTLPPPFRALVAPMLLLSCAVVAEARADSAYASTSADYLARMDGNRDGRVDVREYQEYLSYGFHDMDRDRDGVLSLAELGTRARGRAITLADHRAKLARTFARQDANGDGYLDRVEIAAPPR